MESKLAPNGDIYSTVNGFMEKVHSEGKVTARKNGFVKSPFAQNGKANSSEPALLTSPTNTATVAA